MKYTILGKTGLQVSRLGFGCMRLPMKDGMTVDREKAVPMLRQAVEWGINYFDTAIFYCGGDSQRVVGEALEDLRDRVILSTKNHLHDADEGRWWSQLENSLKLLRTDHLDIYNFHGINWACFENHLAGPDGKLRLMEKARAQGLIRHVSCSFHGTSGDLVRIAQTGVIESITLPYNLINREHEEAMHKVREAGVGIAVMNPVGGGRLGFESGRIRQLTGGEAQNTPEAALRFVLAHPAVTLALSGMSTMDQLEENVRIVSQKNPFTQDQVALIDREAQAIRQKVGVECPACGYCQPCPHGVDIPRNFEVYNEFKIFGMAGHSQNAYANLSKPAIFCAECGFCLDKCPRQINIPKALRRVASELDKKFQDFAALLSLQRVADPETAEVRLVFKNLTDQPFEVTSDINCARGVRCEPGQVRWGMVEASGSVSRVLKITLPAGVGVLEGAVHTRAGSLDRSDPFRIPFFIIPRGGLRWHEAVIPPEKVGGRTDLLTTHGYRVGLGMSGGSILVELDIRSEMHALSPCGDFSGQRMELFVDLRPMKAGGRSGAYGDGADQIMFPLNDTKYWTQSGRKYTLNNSIERTEGGCRIRLELPLSEFIKPEWELAKQFGLDFQFGICDATGKLVGCPTYGGLDNLYQNPRLFAPAFLV